MTVEDLEKINVIVLFSYTFIVGPIQFAYLAKKKGKNPWLTFFICLVLTPYIGGVLLFYTSFFDDKRKKREEKNKDKNIKEK